MTANEVFAGLGLEGAAYADRVEGGRGVGVAEHLLVAPASVMKIQVALAIENLIASGRLEGAEPRVLRAAHRTTGPVGVSLMQDDVTMTVRDLVTAMLTISDNAATDELIAVARVEEINRLVADLGARSTVMKGDVRQMLDEIAREVGFVNFEALVAHRPGIDGPPTEQDVRRGIALSKALDPRHGTRTTAFDTVALLQAIWTNRAAPAEACQRIRDAMARQLTRARIASGFDNSVSIAAKSGALLGVVRNDAGVVTLPDGDTYAVAVFTRKRPDDRFDPAAIDRCIGHAARFLVDELRGG